MKQAFFGTLAAAFVAVGMAGAQTSFSDTDNPHRVSNQLTQAIAPGRGPVDNGRLAPRTTGIATALVTKGPVMVSPTAPKEYGMGEQFLTDNPSRSATPSGRGGFEKGETREFGGLKLFGWDF